VKKAQVMTKMAEMDEKSGIFVRKNRENCRKMYNTGKMNQLLVKSPECKKNQENKPFLDFFQEKRENC
jgi:hypothetical protein